MSFVLSRSNREEADSANDRGVAELRLSRDDRVGDVVIDALYPIISQYIYPSNSVSSPFPSSLKKVERRVSGTDRMLLQLHLQNGTILESPLDDISLRRNTAFDVLALFQSRPEVAEVLELDQVPDIAELCLDDGGLGD
jgi:hypothetical protein